MNRHGFSMLISNFLVLTLLTGCSLNNAQSSAKMNDELSAVQDLDEKAKTENTGEHISEPMEENSPEKSMSESIDEDSIEGGISESVEDNDLEIKDAKDLYADFNPIGEWEWGQDNGKTKLDVSVDGKVFCKTEDGSWGGEHGNIIRMIIFF